MKERKPFYDQIERNLIVLLFIIMTVVIAVNVVTRFVFNYTLSWGEQFAKLLLVWISFAGISWGGKIDVHMRVTALSLLTKKKPAIFEIIYLIGDLAAVIYGFYLSFEIYGVMMMTMRQGQVLSAMPFCPKWIMYLAGVLGMAGFSLRIIQRRIGWLQEKRRELTLT